VEEAMISRALPAATLAAIVGLSVAAYAETLPETESLDAQYAQTSRFQLRSPRLEGLMGKEIRTPENAHGRIVDLLVDEQGQVRAAVIEVGGFLGIGTRKVAVEWSIVHVDANGPSPVLFVDASNEALRRTPEYKTGDPVVLLKASD
jgi:hypothetical protein